MATPSGYNPFKQAPPGASRSPCPALNSLANHSYMYVLYPKLCINWDKADFADHPLTLQTSRR